MSSHGFFVSFASTSSLLTNSTSAVRIFGLICVRICFNNVAIHLSIVLLPSCFVYANTTSPSTCFPYGTDHQCRIHRRIVVKTALANTASILPAESVRTYTSLSCVDAATCVLLDVWFFTVAPYFVRISI